MTGQQLTFVLDMPEEMMTIDEVRGIAAHAGVTLDQWISRCIVEYTRQAALHFADPELKAYFDMHKSMGPINLTPESRFQPAGDGQG